MMQRGTIEETLEISREAADREFRIAAKRPKSRAPENTGPVTASPTHAYSGPSL
jgi:hypothetical protein